MNDPNSSPSYNDPLRPQGGEATAARPFTNPPPVVGWYKAYCVFMSILYLTCIGGGFLLLHFLPQIVASAPNVSPTEVRIRAVVLVALGIIFFIAFVAALLLPKQPWTWIYHIVMIAVGLASCCLWPATIPLMINWLKPRTQEYFGRQSSPSSTPPSDSNNPPPPIPSV